MSLRTRGVVACAVALLATGCSGGPPEIDASALSAAEAQTCRDFVADLPDTLAGKESVEVTGDTEHGAAWGDPAIVLTCGVDPIDITDAPACAEVNGVGWIVPEGEDEGTFTADGYRPRVRLEVPEDYLPEGGAAALTELAGPVKRHLELEDRCL